MGQVPDLLCVQIQGVVRAGGRVVRTLLAVVVGGAGSG